QFACLVEKIHVRQGQTVKKGDPLVDLLSFELAEAKSHYEMAKRQWARDRKVLDSKAPLVEANTLPRKELIEVENEEAQSRLKMKLAKDRLRVYGLNENQIESLDQENDERSARLTLHSPASGTVVELGAHLGNHYDLKDVLVIIGESSSENPGTP